MTPAFAALSAAFLLTGTASAQSQDPAGYPSDAGAAATQAQPSPNPTRPDTRPTDTNGLRDQLLQGAINVLLKPRARAKPPPPAPVDPVPAAVTQLPGVVPREVPAEPTPPAPQPAPAAVPIQPATAVRPAATPKVAPAVQTAAPKTAEPPPAAAPAARDPLPLPLPAPVEVAPAAETPTAVATAPPTPSETAVQAPIMAPQPKATIGLWLLLGLVAALVAVAAVFSSRARRIARTRAALSLYPSLDLTAGSSSVRGLSLAGPQLAIRARLDMGETRHG